MTHNHRYILVRLWAFSLPTNNKIVLLGQSIYLDCHMFYPWLSHLPSLLFWHCVILFWLSIHYGIHHSINLLPLIQPSAAVESYVAASGYYAVCESVLEPALQWALHPVKDSCFKKGMFWYMYTFPQQCCVYMRARLRHNLRKLARFVRVMVCW